ncbi:MAG: hypothetical protein PWQ15_34 [Methanobacterium sp.]|jgi:uncharacterized protein (DUF1786 family)|uniref:DUF1786 domain-containing protein n=1 Tax=Methanobacterium sp. TaxID=2164 RepID=UPI0003C97232|nr:DUF1786 domain-containing protein [Methanobacterium sp.]MDI3548932.1 hypothetical protein [Methanobacterium sp.]CDG64131.1 hypothetical protein MBMB1_0011 [Methanobacterium sp. MB1]
MKILAIDVGTGTQDIMLYDSQDSMENAVKMVLPSPTKIMANRIRQHHHDIFLSGETMGGGPVNKAIQNHLDKGYRVIMNEHSARTVRDDLERVRSMGVEIVHLNEKHPEIAELEMTDVDLVAIKEALSNFDVELDFDFIGVAVQDHGYNESMGDRNFRFQKIREKLNVPRAPEEFAYKGEVPPYFTRMQAVQRTLRNYNPLIMDSKFASICGATLDPMVKDMDRYIAMDVGNGHTLAVSFLDGKIHGIFEHHTGILTPKRIEELINKLAAGTITHEEVHEEQGHGAWVIDAIDSYECIVATGPKRAILEETDLKVYNAAPGGDVMMTGPAGLIKSIQSLSK